MANNCISLIESLDQRDQDAILARLDELEAMGVKPEVAQIQAVTEVLAVAQERAGGVEPDVKRSAERPIFYSQMQVALRALPERLSSMAAPQWRLWLDANAPKLGVKKEEIEWSGVRDWLELQGKAKVTRDQLVEYLDSNGVRVTETQLGRALQDPVRAAASRLEEAGMRWVEDENGVFLVDQDGDSIDDDRLTPQQASDLIALRKAAKDSDGGFVATSRAPTKYETYTVPGGENYREVLITLPGAKASMRKQWALLDARGDTVSVRSDPPNQRWQDLVATRGHRIEEREVADAQANDRAGAYTSSHWDQPNILAHLRVDERTDADGSSVLFINEIQSDWGQDGKKKGFKGDAPSSLSADQVKVIRDHYAMLARQRPQMFGKATETGDMIAEMGMREVNAAMDDAGLANVADVENNVVRAGMVPRAPFVGDTKAWAALALKRAVMMAVHDGHDRVALISGQQAADLYDLSKMVDRIEYEPAEDGTFEIVAIDPRGKRVVEEDGATLERIEELVGKEVATKIAAGDGELQQPGGWGVFQGKEMVFDSKLERDAREYASVADGDVSVRRISGGYRDWRVLSNMDLKVGGEGMRAFYDEIIPQVARDVLKKIGGGPLVKIHLSSDPNPELDKWEAADGEGDGSTAPVEAWESLGFDITPKMREQLANGAPLFSRARPVDSAAFKKWFGDSKVVDDAGEPLVVYHGASVEFTSFDPKTLGSRDPGFFGSGFYFAPTEDEAQGYADSAAEADGLEISDARTIPAYLSLQNPFIWDMEAGDGAKETRAALAKMGIERSSVRGDSAALGNRSERAKFQKAMVDGGFDGVIVRDEDGFREVVAFRPEQIKSATGNRGTFDPDDADITRSTPRGAWTSPAESRWDDMVYKLQDKHVDTKRVVAAVREAAGSIRDDLNVYLQEELYHGRAAKRTEDFIGDELQPLIDSMARDGLKIADLDEYLHARHAKEANAVVAERNPDLPDGGSGMTDAEADAYFAQLPADARAKLDAAAARVDGILATTKKLYVDYGLESKQRVDGWTDMFQHYVPLMREDKEGRMGIGQGFSIKGREVKGRTGSTRKVVDILANIALQRERAIVRGEKNRVAAALVGLAHANRVTDFWTVDEVPTTQVFNEKTGLVETQYDTAYKNRDNVVVAKITHKDGEVREHAVVFKEDDPRALRMAVALKNLDAANLEGLLGASAKITRYFASINTAYNPVFGVVNLVRDVQGAALNLSSTPISDMKAQVVRDIFPALAGIYVDMRKARKGGRGTSAWASLWEEFQNVGGQTGYRDQYANSGDRAAAIGRALDPTAWMDSRFGKIFTAGGLLKVPMAMAQKKLGWMFDLLSDYNESMENGTRLAAYKAGLDKGLSKQQAASIAKNLTTNFNRKGQTAQQAGALYAFFNASMQGTARIGSTLFTMTPGKPRTLRLSKVGKKIVFGGMLLGVTQALLLAAAGFNDEDPPDFARERGLIIPTGGKTYVAIPLPLGFHVLPNLGRIPTEFMLGGFKDPAKSVVKLAGLFADTFNPIGNAGFSIQTLAPTAIDPLVALSENRDWTGKPIAKTSSNRATPGHQLVKDTASLPSKFLSEAINLLSGGNEHVAGAFSPTPDSIDYLFGQIGGGVWREASKAQQSGVAAIRGEDVPIFKVPLVGRFVGNAGSQSSEGTAFYANSEKLNRIETEAKGLRAEGKTQEAADLIRSKPEAALMNQSNAIERQVSRLRREKSELIKNGATRDEVRAKEEAITASMARLNRSMEAKMESR